MSAELIEVRLSNGDSAEAETPEEAAYAAGFLFREAGRAAASSKLTASFYVDGRLVRERVRYSEVSQ